MSNEPIFEKLAREYAESGKSYESMTIPYLSPVFPLNTKQPLMNTPVYGPDPNLDGPVKEPLPKRNLENVMNTLVKRWVSSELNKQGFDERQLSLYRGTEPSRGNRESEETISFRSSNVEVEIPAPLIEIRPKETDDVVYMPVRMEKTLTDEERCSGKTSSDVITELGEAFARKHPNAEVSEVFVVDQINGDETVIVTGMNEQTDESVNAASNEETEKDNEPVILNPNFWKTRNEE